MTSRRIYFTGQFHGYLTTSHYQLKTKYQFHSIFLEKYITAARIANNPMLPNSNA